MQESAIIQHRQRDGRGHGEVRAHDQRRPRALQGCHESGRRGSGRASEQKTFQIVSSEPREVFEHVCPHDQTESFLIDTQPRALTRPQSQSTQKSQTQTKHKHSHRLITSINTNTNKDTHTDADTNTDGAFVRPLFCESVSVNTIHPEPEIHEHIYDTKGYGTLCTTSSTFPTTRSAM